MKTQIEKFCTSLRKKAKATAYISDSQFIVCKNSEFSATETPSCPKYVHERRQELMAEGKVQDGAVT